MRRLIHTLTFVSIFAGAAQARDWGFDKDTVYETNGPAGFYDSIRIVNNSVDTLKFDTATVDIYVPKSGFKYLRLSMGVLQSGPTMVLYSPDDGTAPFGVSAFKIPPNSQRILTGFTMQASPSGTDSLIAKMTFYSGVTSDTAYVKGDAMGCCVAINSPAKSRMKDLSYSSIPARDVKGRNIKVRKFVPVLKQH